MNRLHPAIAGICLTAWAVVAAAEPFTIVAGGGPVAPIVLLPGAGDQAAVAAADLAGVLGRMTGGVVATGTDPAATPAIVVGRAADWAAASGDDEPLRRLAEAGPEHFLLASRGDRLLVLGVDAAGASHGVATLLRDLGCRWFFPGPEWEVIPKRAEVTVDVDRVEGPALAVRILSNGAGAGPSRRSFETWCRRNRLGSAYGSHGVHHSYASYVPKQLFAEHPDWFAMVSRDGIEPGSSRNGEQPCTTHPEVVRRVVDGVLAELRRRRDADGVPPALVSVSPNDGTPTMCRCPRCRETGSYGDCALLLANQVATAAEDEFPDTRVGFLAYGRAGDPPRTVREAHPNVLVSVAAGFNWRTSVPRLVETWSGLAEHVTIYEYYAIGAWGSRRPDNAQPNLARIVRTLRDWHARGIEGVNAEMENDWASCGHRFWAFAECGWDPARETDELLAEFVTGCFGPASEPIRRIYDRWEGNAKATPRVLRLTYDDLAAAARLAADRPEVLRRIDQLGLFLHWHLLDTTFTASQDDTEKNTIALEGDLFQYRWRDAFLVQLTPAVFDIDRPVPVGFTAAEAAELRAADVKRFLPRGKQTDVAAIPPGVPLVAARDRKGFRPLAAAPRSSSFFTESSHVCRADAGETVRVVFRGQPTAKGAAATGDAVTMPTAGDGGLGRFQIWWLGPDGDEEAFLEERNPDAGDGRPQALEFVAERSGLYRINAKCKTTGVHADFGDRPVAVAAPLVDRRDWLPFRKSADAEPPSRERPGAPLYLYVPKGTRHLVLELQAPGRTTIPLAIDTAAGKAVLAAAVPSGGEVVVDVPRGQDGMAWSLRADAATLRLGIGGVPPLVAPHPDLLLVPPDERPAR